jgi:hypothetical protein
MDVPAVIKFIIFQHPFENLKEGVILKEKIKENQEEILKNEKPPFENYPIGPWRGGYSHFCPHCFEPIMFCDCEMRRKVEKN